MEIIKWFGFNTIPIGIIISIFLLIYGKIKHIKYLDPEVPLGRLLFFVGEYICTRYWIFFSKIWTSSNGL